MHRTVSRPMSSSSLVGMTQTRVAASPAEMSASTAMADYGRAGMTDSSYLVGRLMFAALEKTVGPERFRAILGGFFQRYKDSGAGTREFVAWAGGHGGAPARALLSDWLTSTGWLERLRSGVTIDALAASYRGAR